MLRKSYLPLLLIAISAQFLVIEYFTHITFMAHLAAIPLEILAGALIVERYLEKKEKNKKKKQLLHIKSFLFRSELQNVFIMNFNGLRSPKISMKLILNSNLPELRELRKQAEHLIYDTPQSVEKIIYEYIKVQHIFQQFIDWAITNDFDPIFHDMIYILHFIQDVKQVKKMNPHKSLMSEIAKNQELVEKTDRVLSDGVKKFLDYAIELKEDYPDVFDVLMEDYVFTQAKTQALHNSTNPGTVMSRKLSDSPGSV